MAADKSRAPANPAARQAAASARSHFPLDHLEQLSEAVLQSWGAKPLETLRAQAAAAPSGVAFDAIRGADGRRLLLALCAAKPAPLAGLRKAFPQAAGGAADDWRTLTLLEPTLLAGTGRGVAVRTHPNRSAAIVVAAEPRAIANLERLFGLPR